MHASRVSSSVWRCGETTTSETSRLSLTESVDASVTSVSPSSGSEAGGTGVVVSTTGGVGTCAFGTTSLVSARATGAGAYECVSPAHAPSSTVSVWVSVGVQRFGGSSAYAYTVYSVSPTEATASSLTGGVAYVDVVAGASPVSLVVGGSESALCGGVACSLPALSAGFASLQLEDGTSVGAVAYAVPGRVTGAYPLAVLSEIETVVWLTGAGLSYASGTAWQSSALVGVSASGGSALTRLRRR